MINFTFQPLNHFLIKGFSKKYKLLVYINKYINKYKYILI